MKSLENRPLGAFALVWYITAYVLYSFDGNARLWGVVLSFTAFAVSVFLCVRMRSHRTVVIISAAVLTASLFSGFVLDVCLPRSESIAGETYRIIGTVTGVRYSSAWSGCYELSVDGDGVILYADNCELDIGDVVSCTAEYEKLDDSGGYRGYNLSRGFAVAARAVDGIEVIGESDGFGVRLSRIRDSLAGKLMSVMSEENGGFAASLLLGDRSHLSDRITRDFRALGISHLLALSGTHLTVLFAFSGTSFFRKRRLFRFLLITPAVVLYALLTGFSASVVRAGIMMVLSFLAAVFNKKADGVTSLSVSAVLICIMNPYAPYDVGLMFSVCSVMGLILAGRMSEFILKRRAVRYGKLLRAVVTAVVVPVAVLPLMWIYFGQVSLASPVANILLAPAASVLIFLYGATLVLSVIPALFMPAGVVVGGITSLFLGIIKAVSESSDLLLPLGGNAGFICMLAFCVFTLAAFFCVGRIRNFAFVIGAVSLCLSLVLSQARVCGYNTDMTVCYASAKTGDAVCFMKKGYGILVDMNRYTASVSDAAELAEDCGSGSFDALFLTRSDDGARHTALKMTEKFFVDTLWLPIDGMNGDDVAVFCGDIHENGAGVNFYLPGECLTVGDYNIIAPEYTDGKDLRFEVSFDSGEVRYQRHGLRGSGKLELSGNDEMHVVSGAYANEPDCVSPNTVITDEAVITCSRGEWRSRDWKD